MGNFNEPWRAVGDLVEDAKGVTVAMPACRRPCADEIRQADRVAACVNALAGVSDPAALLAVFDEMRAVLECGHVSPGIADLLARAAAVRGGR